MQAAMDQAYRFLAQRFLSSYELTQKMVRKAEKGEINITDSIYKLENIEYVNLVMQNDEISN